MVGLATDEAKTAVISTRALLRVLLALRVFFGLDWLSNAVAKLIGVANYHWGFITFNLVDRGTALSILHDANTATYLAPLRWFYANAVVANWGTFQWLQAVIELAIGIGLTFGIATRLAALGGILLIGPIWLMLLPADQYFWTYPLDLFPLVLLAIMPAGRIRGFDRRLAPLIGNRWPC